MSQSPLARSARKNLPVFAHPPSGLSKSSIPSTPASNNGNSPSSLSISPSSTAGNKYSTPSRKTRETESRYAYASATPYAGIEGLGIPITPRIHYSPTALSTPPQGLSKSSSVPFDMAASAKAARISKQSRLSMPAGENKKRFVRKKPFYQRAFELPSRIKDKFIYHTPNSIEDFLPETRLANPIALGFHIFHFLLVVPLFNSSEDTTTILRSTTKSNKAASRWEQDERTRTGLLSGWGRAIFLFILASLAAGNALYLFTHYRTYDMLLRSADAPVHSPHASPIPAPQIKSRPVGDDEEEITSEEDELRARQNSIIAEQWVKRAAVFILQTIWFLIKSTFHGVLSAFGKSHKGPTFKDLGQKENRIQSLRVWDPPEFCLAFFCVYPPTAPLLTSFLSPYPFLTPFLHLSTSFLLSHLSQSYSQLVKDRMLLSAEVMREYDQRFVYKKVFAHMVDRGTSTNESEFVDF
ncbi:hypothetical protein L204_102240 [Cryptococcus depauperatus]|nr:hypothetical protein L204_04737 [Cryptococcus depauperatus CBS 7855]